eukprot:403353683
MLRLEFSYYVNKCQFSLGQDISQSLIPRISLQVYLIRVQTYLAVHFLGGEHPFSQTSMVHMFLGSFALTGSSNTG